MEPNSESHLNGATIHASDPTESDLIRPDVLHGPTEKVPTGWVGSMMSNAERWLAEEKSFEITGVGILLSLVVGAAVLGFVVGGKYQNSKADRFTMNGYHYQMRGVAEVPGQKGVYLPIYMEAQK